MGIKKIKFNTFVAFCLFIFSGLYFWQAFGYSFWATYSPGPGFFPRIVGGLLTALTFICLMQSLREEGIKFSEAFPKGTGLINTIVVCGALIFFIVFAKLLGFMVTSILMMTAMFSRGTKWYRALLYAIITTVLCYYVFKILLMVPVPVNKYGW